MSKPWPMVKLGEVLSRTGEIITPDPSREYSEITVRLWGKGVVERGRISGASVNGKRFVAKAGNFIASRIDARNGAMGLVPESLDGALVTNDFPLFEANESRLDLSFLGWLTKTKDFVELCLRASEGTTNRVRLKEDRFVALEIPLPPLSEQRRIVARIEELAAQIHEAQGLRKEAAEEAEAMLRISIANLIAPESVTSVTVEKLTGDGGLRNGKSLKSAGSDSDIRCLTLSSMRNGRIDLNESKPVPMSKNEANQFSVRKNDVFIVRGNGTKDLCGRAGVVLSYESGRVFPDLFIRVSLPENRILPAYFVAVWNSALVRKQIEQSAKTTSGIWKVNQGHILSTRIPLPPHPEQRRIVAGLDALQAEVDSLKRLQAETSAELDALLPAILDRAFKGNP